MECHPERPGQAQEIGPWKSHVDQQEQMQDAAPGSGQPKVSSQAGDEQIGAALLRRT